MDFQTLAKSTAKLSDLLVGILVDICVDGKIFSKICVEDLEYFRFSYSNADWFTDHWHTPIIIATAGDSSVSRVAFRCAESVEEEIGEHFLRFTDDGGNYPRN